MKRELIMLSLDNAEDSPKINIPIKRANYKVIMQYTVYCI